MNDLKRKKGFSLIELAIGLLIFSMILFMGIGLLSIVNKQKKLADSERVLARAEDALLGYILVYGRLPCPDDRSDADFGENCGSYTPPAFLPYDTVNLPAPSTGAGSPKIIYYDVTQVLTMGGVQRDITAFCTVLWKTAREVAGGGTIPGIRVQVCVNPPACTNLRDVAAVLINNFEGPLRGDNADNDNIYESESRSYEEGVYDDKVKEISYQELLEKICANKVKIRIVNNSGGSIYYVKKSSCPGSGCVTVPNGESFFIAEGEVVSICDSACNDLAPPKNNYSFSSLVQCDWDGTGCTSNPSGARDGEVSWDGSNFQQ